MQVIIHKLQLVLPKQVCGKNKKFETASTYINQTLM